jgi:hypothetical protein
VALTRPRSELWHLNPPDVRGIRYREPTRRWVRWFVRPRLRFITECEIEGADVHSLDPAGAFVTEDDPRAIQDYIRTAIRPGDPVTLSAVKSDVEGTERTYYLIRHRDRLVGVTSSAFNDTLIETLRLTRTWTVRMPTDIEDVFVEGIDTGAGSAAVGLRAGLGRAGFWLRVRVAGLGRLRYPK